MQFAAAKIDARFSAVPLAAAKFGASPPAHFFAAPPAAPFAAKFGAFRRVHFCTAQVAAQLVENSVGAPESALGRDDFHPKFANSIAKFLLSLFLLPPFVVGGRKKGSEFLRIAASPLPIEKSGWKIR